MLAVMGSLTNPDLMVTSSITGHVRETRQWNHLLAARSLSHAFASLACCTGLQLLHCIDALACCTGLLHWLAALLSLAPPVRVSHLRLPQQAKRTPKHANMFHPSAHPALLSRILKNNGGSVVGR